MPSLRAQIKYYTRCLSSCFRKVNLCSRFSLWSRIALVIFRNITYVALTNNMTDTCVRLRQTRARPGLCQVWARWLHNRELKQATFLSTRTSTGSKPRRYRWRMMASAVLVWNHERESWLTAVVDFKRERLTPSLAIYNGAIYFRLTSVLTKTSPA